MKLNDSLPGASALRPQHPIYPKLGGDLGQACQRLATGLRVPGIVIVLCRGGVEEIEVAAAFREYFEIGSRAFRELAREILRGGYAASLATVSEGCRMFVEATGAESVAIFRIGLNGGVRIEVSAPAPKEMIAAYAARLADDFDSRN